MDIGSLVEHLSVIQADAGTAARRLSTSGLANHSKCLTLVNFEGDIIHGL